MPRRKKEREKSDLQILIEFHRKCGLSFEEAVQRAHADLLQRQTATN